MALTQELIDLWARTLGKLLPRGRAWTLEEQPNLTKQVTALAPELCRQNDEIVDLLEVETNPSTTDDLLPDWEEFLGLPDECTPAGLTDDERRAQLVQRMTVKGSLSVEFLQEQIEALGVVGGEVYSFEPFLAGRNRAGDPLTNGFDDRFRAGDRCGDRLYIWGWTYYFCVILPSLPNELVECTVNKLKPANAGVIFTTP